MTNRKYKKRSPGDVLENGAVLVERVNGRLWRARCGCGELFVVQPSSTKGRCRRCALKQLSLERTIHGESPDSGKGATRLYRIWTGMRNRCANPKNHDFSYYGGRGISVCEEWEDYLQFKSWAIENGYSNELTIDRIDVDGNYTPENCRWITQSEQCKNKRKRVAFHTEKTGEKCDGK